MKRTTFTTLFFLKKSKLLRTGEAPIYCRITVNTLRVDFAIKRSILPENWNTQKGCAKGGLKVKELNHYLDHVKNLLYENQKNLEDSGRKVTAKSLLLAYHGVYETEKYLIEMYDEHNQNLAKMINTGVAKNTYIRHNTSRKHLKEFIEFKFKQQDIPICDVNPKFIDDYYIYLRSDRKCNHNSSIKYIKNFKKIIKSAIGNGWIKSDPFLNTKFKFEETETVYLNKEELNSIEKKDFGIARLNYVKDTFLFCCFTGLAFVDVQNLHKSDISDEIDGWRWISKKRLKTNTKFSVPLIDKAKDLIDKYKENPLCKASDTVLPVISNQRMNAYLKEIADLCGIKKNLTTHSARHTFATTVTLANKISIEVVSKMLGHSSIDMTKHYARITEDLISREMNKIRVNNN